VLPSGKRSQGWWRFEINDMADLIEATVALKIEDTLSMKIERFTWAKVGRLSNLGWDHTPLLLSQI